MKLPSKKIMFTVGISAAMFICGVVMLAYGLYKYKHHPTGPPHGMPTGMMPTRMTATPTKITGIPSGSSTKDSRTSTEEPPSTFHPLVTCDLQSNPTAIIFLVDIADSQISNLETKFANVKRLLLGIPSKLNLKGSWRVSKLGVAVYYGNHAYLLNNRLCSSDSCWTATVGNLTNTLNRYRITVHNATRGLQYIYEEFGRVYGQLNYGIARKLVIIADGYEFTTWSEASDFAQLLHNNYFSISSIVVTQSTAIVNAFSSCADNSYNIYKLDTIYEITDKTVLELAADWCCRAYTVTTQASTILPTKPQIPTTTETPIPPGQLPPRAPICEQFIDLVIVYHSTEANNCNILKSFIGEELITTLLGNSTTSINSAYNIAILNYVDNVVSQLTGFDNYRNATGYQNVLKDYAFKAPTTTQTLSNAFNQINQMFQAGRYFTSKIIVVFTDYIDPFDAEAAKKRFDSLPTSYVLGVEVETKEQTLTVPNNELAKIDTYSSIDSSQPLSRRQTGNQIANKICRYIALKTTKPPTTTTTSPPTLPPPAVEPREVWPDIAILIDASETVGSAEFEMIREFLQHTLLERYSITPRNTRVSVALFNSDVVIKSLFNQVTSYYDLKKTLGANLEYGEISPSPVRDLTKALSTLLTTVYVETVSDYNPFKENFLWIFLTGSPSNNNYINPLRTLQKMGIRTEAIGLGNDIDNSHLSQFGYTSFQVSNWSDDSVGINAYNSALTSQLFEDTTSRRTQPLSQIVADFYFVIDHSTEVTASDFTQIHNFLTSFTSRLTLNELHCGVSIAPFSDDVANGLQLTYSETDLTNYFNNFKYDSLRKADSNIGKAAETLKQLYLKNNNRSNHVIFIVTSENSIGYDTVLTTLNNVESVFAIGLKKEITYLNAIAKVNCAFNLNAPMDLQDWVEDIQQKTIWNPLTQFFKSLANVQENYMQSNPIPLNELNADFVFAIDLTLVSNQTFPIVKKYILDFAEKLNINPTGAQIAAHCYTDQNNVENGFHFSEIKNYNDLVQKVNSLKLETNDVNLPSDIAGAYVDIANYILLASNGWREGPTYVITLSTATKLLDNPAQTAQAKRLIFGKAQSLGLNMDGKDDETAGFLRLFTPDYYAVVEKVQDLNINANYSNAMFDKIDKLYKTYNFPEAPSLPSIVADFVFIIDHSTALTAAAFAKIQNFMLALLDQGTFLPQNSRLGVLSYDSFGIVTEETIYINEYLNKNVSMKAAIVEAIKTRLVYKNDMYPSNLKNVMEYVVRNGSSFGLRNDVPVIITLFAASEEISDFIPSSLTNAFDARRLTYAFETSNLSYIDRFLGSQRLGNVQITKDFQFSDIVYRDFIDTGYQRWMATFAGNFNTYSNK